MRFTAYCIFDSHSKTLNLLNKYSFIFLFKNVKYHIITNRNIINVNTYNYKKVLNLKYFFYILNT